MKRLRPLSHSLALLAVTSLSLAPAVAPAAYADIQTTTTTSSVPTEEYFDAQTTTSTADTTPVTTTTTVTPDNLAEIIAGLTSSDMETVQARYDELQDLIATQKAELASLPDGTEKTELAAYIANLETVEDAFEAIIEAYEEDNAETVISTETITNSDGSTTTRVTYADGNYTETTTPAEDDTDSSSGGNSESPSGSGGSSGGGGGGLSEILSQLMENPAVQAIVTSLLQKLLGGNMGNLSSLLSGLLGTGGATGDTTTPSIDTLLGRTCIRGKCNASDYGTPNPQ